MRIKITYIVTIVFLILKLTNAISWPYLWVLSPLWIKKSLEFVDNLLELVVYILEKKDKIKKKHTFNNKLKDLMNKAEKQEVTKSNN